MNLSLEHKRAIVCGSTQGIGRAAAHELAGLGASVTLIARNEQALRDVCRALPAHTGQSHDFFVADFTDPDAVRTAARHAVDAHGAAHILVNNTGGPQPGPAIDADPEGFQRAFAQHLIGNQVLAQAVVPGMKDAKYGRIINVISTSVREPIRGLGISNTIRAAVAGWSKTLSVELGPFGITVNNVLPGATQTERNEAIIRSAARNADITEEAMRAQKLAEIPLGRFATAEEVGGVIAFLATPAAAYISGVSLQVDGGRMRSI